MNILELHSVSKTINMSRIISNVSFGLQRGEIVSLVGKSGSGKTSLLRLIAGLDAPTSGKIVIDGQIASIDSKLKIPPQSRRVGVVFQDYALWPHMTVMQHLSTVSTNNTQQNVEILQLVGLDQYHKNYPNQLSGGQQQRVSLARAIASNPSIILFDEPLSNVDASTKEVLQSEIVAILKRLNISAIYITHDISEAYLMGDRVAIMDNGHIVQCDTPSNCYYYPVNGFVATLTGAIGPYPASICADFVPDKSFESQVYFRPESLTIDNNGILKGMVSSCKFLNGRWKLNVIVDHTYNITLFSNLPIDLHTYVGIDVKWTYVDILHTHEE